MTFEFNRAAKDVVVVIVPINKQIDMVVVDVAADAPVDVAANEPVDMAINVPVDVAINVPVDAAVDVAVKACLCVMRWISEEGTRARNCEMSCAATHFTSYLVGLPLQVPPLHFFQSPASIYNLLWLAHIPR